MTNTDPRVLDDQRRHWRSTFESHPTMYGPAPSGPALAALELFEREGVRDVLELGAGQGRDTIAFLRAGMTMTALDYAPEGLAELSDAATAAGLSGKLTTAAHDVRNPLPLPDESVDAVFSHMLFNMALTTDQLMALASEVRRVLRPAGWHIYTVRHTGDPHAGTGVDRGDNMTERGGFIVHFFDQDLVNRLSQGFSAPEIIPFEEGDLPRRLWRVTQRKSHPTGDVSAHGQVGSVTAGH
jgi:SAM-dependent methyltransferase